MISKKQRLIILAIAAHLLLIAIVCYAAFPMPTPEQPIRLIYRTNAGKVLFDHKAHSSHNANDPKMGYGLACADCHHHPADTEETPSCGTCHPVKIKKDEVPKACLDCHDSSEVSDAEYPKRSDAFHQQCMGCHDQFGKGPRSGSANCSKCHVL